MIRGEPDMEGLLLGSRELLCLSSRISRTLVSCSSLSELYFLGKSVSYQIQGESVGWWSNFILSPHKTGWFFRGARHVTSPSRQSGADTSSRPLTGTGARHVTSLSPDRARHTTSLPPTRVHCPLCGCPSASFYLRRFNPFLFRRLGFFSFSITVFVTASTLTHLRPGPSGVTGFMGSLFDLMRRNWGY
jgi:hypothetical protein